MEALLFKYKIIDESNFKNLVYEIKNKLTPTNTGTRNSDCVLIEWQLYESDGIHAFLLVAEYSFDIIDDVYLFVCLNRKLIICECKIMGDHVVYFMVKYFRSITDFKTFTTEFVMNGPTYTKYVDEVYYVTPEWIFSTTNVKSAR